MSRSNAESPDHITNKETIKRQIRHALNENKNSSNETLSRHSFSYLNYSDKEDLKNIFLNNFRAAGGLYIGCTAEDCEDKLVRLLKAQNLQNLIVTGQKLSEKLKTQGFHIYPSIPKNFPPDAAVVNSYILVASNGSILFSPSFSHYPTIKNISKNIIVIAKEKHISPDFKTTIEMMDRREEQKGIAWNLLEFIRPNAGGDNKFSFENPRIILLLIAE